MALTYLHPACFAIAVLLTASGCQQSTNPELDTSEDLYFSSFESDADAAGWSGYGGGWFDQDAPPDGGARSLRVSGGCIVPHFSRRVVAPAVPCSVSLTFWGKNLALGGGVSLRPTDGVGPEIQVSVQETVWTRYRSASRIHCRPGDTLVLDLISGGIIYGAMRVDLLEVRIDE